MTDTSSKILYEALDNLRKDRKAICVRIDALVIESKTYNQPQKELSITKSVAKLFEVLQKINSEIIKISSQLEKAASEEFVFDAVEEDVYSSIGDALTVKVEK